MTDTAVHESPLNGIVDNQTIIDTLRSHNDNLLLIFSHPVPLLCGVDISHEMPIHLARHYASSPDSPLSDRSIPYLLLPACTFIGIRLQ